MEAAVITIRCNKKNIFGVRIQKMEDGDWWRTWAFPTTKRSVKAEKFQQQIKGSLRPTKEYPGCPYCGATRFIRCDNCGKLTCYHGEAAILCSWCGINITDIYTLKDGVQVTGGSV